MDECVHHSMYEHKVWPGTQRSEEGIRCLELELTDYCVPSHGSWELKQESL